VAGGELPNCVDRRCRQGRPPEVGVKDHAGCIDDASERPSLDRCKVFLDERFPVDMGNGGIGITNVRDGSANCFHHRGPRMGSKKLSYRR
jgi:hypothetical protein